jgi:hypothetical protein
VFLKRVETRTSNFRVIGSVMCKPHSEEQRKQRFLLNVQDLTIRCSLFYDVTQHSLVLGTAVSGQSIGTTFLDCLTLEDGTDRLS